MFAEAGSGELFRAVSKRDECGYCDGSLDSFPIRPHIDAVICISTRDQPDRGRRAVDHFHQIGLCRELVLYQPMRGRDTQLALWCSHRAVATFALQRGFEHVLILEDDATFARPWSAVARKLVRAIARLPDDWWGLYLGHLPLQGYFVRPSIMRVRSGCAHAYLAGPRLLRWLAATEPMEPNVPSWRLISTTIDAALANLPGMYALFPMMATQRFMGEHRIDPYRTPDGKRRKLTDKARYREFVIFHCLRLAEVIAAILSPLHWLIMQRRRRRATCADARNRRV